MIRKERGVPTERDYNRLREIAMGHEEQESVETRNDRVRGTTVGTWMKHLAQAAQTQNPLHLMLMLTLRRANFLFTKSRTS